MELVTKAEGGHNVRHSEHLPSQDDLDNALGQCYQFILKCRAKRKGKADETGSDLCQGIDRQTAR